MTERYDVIVVGAGPAGLAAARAAASHGARVGLLDAQARVGGQVWRHDVARAGASPVPRELTRAIARARVEWMPQSQVVAAERGGLLVEGARGSRWLQVDALILATGARELLLPFPGWTLPGVTGAGGLQALAKQGWPLAGKRLVIAGSGPLLLAAAATARRHGAQVLGIHEQAGFAAVHRFATGLWRWPGKAMQTLRLRTQLAGIPYRCGSVVTHALGNDRLQVVELDGPSGRQQLVCDQLAVGYGLLPNVELAQALGCELENEGVHPRVCSDERQRTSVTGVFAAGEICGVGGMDVAVVEGAIAGHTAVGAMTAADGLLRRRRHQRAFAAHLYRHFALDARVLALADPETLICRCEDVPLHALDGHTDARSAKLASRCGMGACQGRLCGSVLAAIGRFPRGDLRPPLFPTRLATLGDTDFPADFIFGAPSP
ncbi:MAG: FAD/NAD(P)-binding oxidoreductase [Rhodanobacter sp.]